MRRVHCSLPAGAVAAVALAAVLSGCADGGKPVTLASTLPSSPPAGVEAAGSTDTGRGTPTGTKRAESILWFNDGVWWANMWDVISNDFHIFKLDPTTRTWKDDRVLADGRADTHADVLWNGTKLFIASHQFPRDTQPAVAGDPSLLFRYSYDSASQEVPARPRLSRRRSTPPRARPSPSTRTPPARCGPRGSRGTPSTSTPRPAAPTRRSGARRTPCRTPAGCPSTTPPRSCRTAATGSGSCGAASTARHRTACTSAATRTGLPRTSGRRRWLPSRVRASSDDHINLKADKTPGGHLYAAVKNSNINLKLPLLELLDLNTATGRWTHHTIAKVSECANRVTLLVDEKRRMLRTFATYPKPAGSTDAGVCTSSGGAIYEKSTSMDKIAFPPGRGRAADHRPEELCPQRLVDQAEHRPLDGAGGPRRQLRHQQVLVLLLAGGTLTPRIMVGDAARRVSPDRRQRNRAPTSATSPCDRGGRWPCPRRPRAATPARTSCPGTIERSDPKAQRTFAKAHDAAADEYGDAERAHRVAYSALKHTHEKVGDHWQPKDSNGPSDDRAAGRWQDSKAEPPAASMPMPRRSTCRRSRELDVPGRSTMTKDELVEAIGKANDRASARARRKG